MNIAFSSLLILLFALPGYVSRSAYLSRGFNEDALPAKNPLDDIARAIFFSLPFHVVGIVIIHVLAKLGVGVGVDGEMLLRLIIGDYGNESQFLPAIIIKLQRNAHGIFAYFALIVIMAFYAGQKLRDQVWKHQWDVEYRTLFGSRNQWLYTLFGRGVPVGSKKVLVYVDAMTDMRAEVPGKRRLYRGVVYAFTTAEDGTLKDIILTEARRGRFTKLPTGDINFEWKPIQPGSLFVLKYSEVKNLNVTYVPIP